LKNKIGNILGLLLVVGMLVPVVLAAPASAAPGPASGNGIQPVEVPSNPVCPAGTTELKVEPVEDGTYSDGTLTVTVDERATAAGEVFDFTANIGVDVVIAKGGPNGNVYTYNPEATSDTNLHAPINPSNGQFYGLSHISFCYDVSPPDLSIEKSSDAVGGTVDEGGSFTYTITVENTGDLPAHNVTVTDNLDDALTVNSVTPSQGTCAPVGAGNTISCNLGTLNGLIAGPPTTATVTIAVTAPVLDASEDECVLVVRNTATVDSDETTAETSNEVVITIIGDRQVVLNKTTTIAVDEDTEFVFDIYEDSGVPDDPDTDDVDESLGDFVGTLTVTILAGETSGTGSLGGLEEGDYIAVETDAGGFSTAPNTSFTIGEGVCEVSIDVENTFEPASAQVQKVTAPEGGEAGWTFNLFFDVTGDGPSADDTLFSTVETTDANAIAFPDALVEGDYYIVEVEQDGFANLGGTGECSFTVNYPADADRLYSCTYTNAQEATAEVKKITVPAGFEAGWEFELFLDNAPAGPDAGDTSIATATTTGTGAVDFGVTLGEGDYYVVETEQVGWESDGGDAGCTFTVEFPADAAEVFTCTFTNTATGTISVQKTENGTTSTNTYTFELRQGAADSDPGVGDDTPGTLLDTEVITADNLPVQLDGDLAPGTYQVCEFVMPGASATFTGGTGTPFTLTLGGDNSRLCTDVEVTVENQDITLTVDNTPPPGGEARTIGFWKNWTSCDGKGNQDPVLDQTLALAEPGGVLIGDLVLHGSAANPDQAPDCLKAIRILDKSKINTGQKQASDPAFSLAAQLLAAKLNVLAGASHACIDSTIAQAQALLDLINFNGITHNVMTAAQKTLANNLANTLDLYNNNGC
jgi:uncharacterized repeat protein (TIGR01451 family)